MTVDDANPKGGTTTYEGDEYGFCSARCRERFEADPRAFLGGKPAAASTLAAGSKWTCPMHPQVVADGPGACPLCGMALEPVTVSLDEIGRAHV